MSRQRAKLKGFLSRATLAACPMSTLKSATGLATDKSAKDTSPKQTMLAKRSSTTDTCLTNTHTLARRSTYSSRQSETGSDDPYWWRPVVAGDGGTRAASRRGCPPSVASSAGCAPQVASASLRFMLAITVSLQFSRARLAR